MALQKRKIFTTIDGVDVLDLTKSEKTEIVKHASINKSDQTDLNGFDIHTAIKENPEDTMPVEIIIAHASKIFFKLNDKKLLCSSKHMSK